MTVPFDYDTDPQRYRLGMQIAHRHSTASLYDWIAAMLAELHGGTVLDVGCADGALRAAMPVSGPRVVGVDKSATLLRRHPAPVVQADATQLPFADGIFDAVTAVNVFYHLHDPLAAAREAHRVLHPGGHLLAATVARNDSPEFRSYWTRPPTSFDAEDAPGLLAQVFDTINVHRWDAPLVTLPTAEAVRDYLLGRQAPADVAETAARRLPVPLTVTKRGALVHATRNQDSAMQRRL